jgi:hypothetical protein
MYSLVVNGVLMYSLVVNGVLMYSLVVNMPQLALK